MKTTLRNSLLAALGAVLSLSLATSGPAVVHQAHAAPAIQQHGSEKASQTAAALRDLWVGHVFWVRSVAVASFGGNTEAAKAAEQQVVANANAIAAAIEPFYGAPAEEALFKLLADHYGGVKAYLVATAAGRISGQDSATEALTSNADEIAAFLSKANPHLKKDAVAGLLLAHATHHIRQIQELKDGKYEAEAETWEEMKNHMYQIADALTDALVRQFPAKF
jgi:hypothetical protein